MKSVLSLFILALVFVSGLSAQQRIRLGQSIEGELDSGSLKLDDGSYYDLYRYDSPGNETVVVVLESDDFDAYLMVGTLNDGTFTSMDMDDDGAGGTNSRLEVRLEKAGTYYFRANTIAADETGSYTIRLSASDSAPTDRMLTLGQRVSGTLTASSLTASDDTYYDAYLIRGVPNTTVSISLESDDFDAYLVIGLPGDDFESIESDDDGAGGTNSRLVYTFPDSRIYEIRANTLSEGETGSYTLSISAGSASNPTPGPMRRISIDSRLTGTLTSASQRLDDDSYYEDILLTGEANAMVSISLTSSDFDSYLNFGRIVNGEFESIQSNDDCSSESTASSCVTFTFADNGTYVIRANTLNEGETGEFILYVLKKGMYTAREATALPALAMGRDVNGELKEGDPIPPGGTIPIDDYKITVRRGDTIELSLASDDFDTVLTLLDSAYEQIDTNDDEESGGTNSKLVSTFSQAGTYVVRVSSLSANSLGAYTLKASKK